MEFDEAFVHPDWVKGAIHLVFGSVFDIFAIMSDVGIAGDELIGDDLVGGCIEIK